MLRQSVLQLSKIERCVAPASFFCGPRSAMGLGLNRSAYFSTQMSSGVMTNKIGVNGVNLYYEQVGSGPMAVLLMPGALGSTQTDFKPQLEKLNRELFTIIAFDPRGYGKSRPPDRDFPIDFFYRDAKDARDLMVALGHFKYSLLGWSDGGITGQIIAGTYPAEVQKLVVWGSSAYVTDKDEKMYEATRDIRNWSERMKAPMIAVYGKEYFEQTWHAWCDGVLQFRQQRNGDICMKEVSNIVCPTLIIHGELDPMVPMEHAQYLSKTIKGSRLIVWPQAKHNLHLRYADDFNREIEQFLTAAASKSPL